MSETTQLTDIVAVCQFDPISLNDPDGVTYLHLQVLEMPDDLRGAGLLNGNYAMEATTPQTVPVAIYSEVTMDVHVTVAGTLMVYLPGTHKAGSTTAAVLCPDKRTAQLYQDSILAAISALNVGRHLANEGSAYLLKVWEEDIAAEKAKPTPPPPPPPDPAQTPLWGPGVP